ncbi:MAG: RNase J family beta-CASP ribonuclease [Candidatus Pacearchaeota archaeon]
MLIKLHAIGGYDEVGRNMTCLELEKDAFIFDCGLFLPPIVEMEDSMKAAYNEKMLRSIDAVPNDLILDESGIKNKVKALLVTHAHLDHVGAIPFLASRYPNAEIASTPFTIEVLKTLLKDNEIKLKNPLRVVTPNSSFKNNGYKIEFINITHSTIQTAMIAVHTEKGVILYANDFKFDNSPILGKKPNYERLIELGNEGVLALIVDSLYSGDERKTPSEKIARDLLEDVLLGTNNKDGCIIVTTFSSHIARLKSIVDFGKQLNRKIIFLGRSLYKYVSSAARLRLAPFVKDIELVTYANQIKKKLKQIEKERNKWLIVCTGHQGEPDSVLDKLSRDYWPFKFSNKDHVIFSSRVIPSPINIANRSRIEKRLKEKGARIFTDVHTSGHCGREDLRDLITMLKPKHIIPAHGDLDKRTPLAELAGELGYRLGETIHLLQNGQVLKID